jgi:hypothetical protein
MKLFRKLYLIFKREPYGTDEWEFSFKFIIKKNDRITNYATCEISPEMAKNIEYIKKYGNILEPVKVSACNFNSNKWIIRENIAGYHALKFCKMPLIPIQIIK